MLLILPPQRGKLTKRRVKCPWVQSEARATPWFPNPAEPRALNVRSKLPSTANAQSLNPRLHSKKLNPHRRKFIPPAFPLSFLKEKIRFHPRVTKTQTRPGRDPQIIRNLFRRQKTALAKGFQNPLLTIVEFPQELALIRFRLELLRLHSDTRKGVRHPLTEVFHPIAKISLGSIALVVIMRLPAADRLVVAL